MIIHENKLLLFDVEYSLLGDLLYDSRGYLNGDVVSVVADSDNLSFTLFFKNEALATEYWQVFCSLNKEMNIL